MSHIKQRVRATSLDSELSSAQTRSGETRIEHGFGSLKSHRLSLDSKVAQIPQHELLSEVDDNLLIQEIKARIISSEVNEERRKLRRSRSVQDLIKAFDNVQFDAILNNGGRTTVRFLLGKFTFHELCEELRKRGRDEDLESQNSQDMGFFHWNGLRRIFFPRLSRNLSQSSIGKMVIVPEIVSPECGQEQDSSLDSFEACEESKVSVANNNCLLQLPKTEKKPCFEPDLQKEISSPFQSSDEETELNEDEDANFFDVLDEIITLKKTLWGYSRDMEELSTKVTKLRNELAKLRQMRTVDMKTC